MGKKIAGRARRLGDETGMLLRDDGGFMIWHNGGGRERLDLRRTPVDEVEQRVGMVGTYVGDKLINVHGVSLA